MFHLFEYDTKVYRFAQNFDSTHFPLRRQNNSSDNQSTMDTDNTPAVKEYPLMYPTKPASLEKLASTRFALDLCAYKFNSSLHDISPLGLSEDFPFFYAEFSCAEILLVGLPNRIMEIIDERVRSSSKELTTLYKNLAKAGILNNYHTFTKCLNSLTYGPDGEICFETSVRNFLTRNEFLPWVKYEIACVYWFEEDIRRIRPSVPYISKEKLTECILNDILDHWIITENTDYDQVRILDNSDTWNYALALMMKLRSWTTFEHMLNSLDTENQQHLLDMLFRKHKANILVNLLSKLNREQVNFVLREKLEIIVMKLASTVEYFEYVLKIWNLAREFIDVEHFSRLVWYLCWGAYFCDNDESFFGSRMEPSQIEAVLLEIWIIAPSRLKNEFFRNAGDIENLFASVLPISENKKMKSLHLDFRFFLELFSDMPVEMRMTVWAAHWQEIASRSNSGILSRLLNLLLKSENKMKRFVEEEMMNFAKAESMIDYWLEKQQYFRVIDYAKLCSWNTNLAREFIEQVFSSRISFLGALNCDKLIELGAIIDSYVLNVDEEKCAQRTEFFSNQVQNLIAQQLEEGLLTYAIQATEYFLLTERSSHEKRLFLDHLRRFKMLIQGFGSDVGRWREFLPFFDEFYFPVDMIFEKLVLEAVSRLSLSLGCMEMETSEELLSSTSEREEFAPVEDFLMWYFGSEAKVCDYKLRMIRNHEEMNWLKNLLQINNQCITNNVLRWFFNGEATITKSGYF